MTTFDQDKTDYGLSKRLRDADEPGLTASEKELFDALKKHHDEEDMPGEVKLGVGFVAAFIAYQFLHSVDWRLGNLFGGLVATWVVYEVWKD